MGFTLFLYLCTGINKAKPVNPDPMYDAKHYVIVKVVKTFLKYCRVVSSSCSQLDVKNNFAEHL